MKGRDELTDDEILRKGDAIWFHGKWNPIPERHIGLTVGSMAYLYAVSPRPTFGRLKKRKKKP